MSRDEILAKIVEITNWMDALEEARPDLDLHMLESGLADLEDQVEVE